jgi:hypothetical protein
MMPLIEALKAVLENVSIDFCSGNIGMSKHGLHSPEVCPSLQEVSGERVPQEVGSKFNRNLGLAPVISNDFPKSLTRHGNPSGIEEKDLRLLSLFEGWSALFQVVFYGVECRFTQRNNPNFPSFS